MPPSIARIIGIICFTWKWKKIFITRHLPLGRCFFFGRKHGGNKTYSIAYQQRKNSGAVPCGQNRLFGERKEDNFHIPPAILRDLTARRVAFLVLRVMRTRNLLRRCAHALWELNWQVRQHRKEIYNLEGIEIEVEKYDKNDKDAERRRLAYCFRMIREKSGMSRTDFSVWLGVPYRTIFFQICILRTVTAN